MLLLKDSTIIVDDFDQESLLNLAILLSNPDEIITPKKASSEP